MSQEAVPSGYGEGANDRTDASERYPIDLRLPHASDTSSNRPVITRAVVLPRHQPQMASALFPECWGVFMTPRCFGHLNQVLHWSTQKTTPSAGAMGLPSPGR